MQNAKPPITDALVAELADQADVDPRTLIRRLAGLPVRRRACARIDNVLRLYGLLPDEQSRAA